MNEIRFSAELDYSFIEQITAYAVKNIKNASQAGDISELVAGLYYFTDNILYDIIDDKTQVPGVCKIDNTTVIVELSNIPPEYLKTKKEQFAVLKKHIGKIGYDESTKKLTLSKYLYVIDEEFDSQLSGVLKDIKSSEVKSSETIDDSFVGLNPAEAEKIINQLRNIDKLNFYCFDRFLFDANSSEILSNLYYYRRVIPGQIISATLLPVLKSKQFKSLEPGENILISKNRNSYFSKINGRVRWIDEKLEVSAIQSIDKSVSNYPKDIICENSLIVNGSVSNCGYLKTGKDLYIIGDLVNTGVSVKGDLYVSGKISNCDSKPFIVTGNIITSGIYNSKLTSESNILVSEEIISSSISATGDIILDGNKQLICGGLIESGKSVVCGIIGDGETQTEISLKTVSKENIEKSKLINSKNEADRELKKINQTFKELTEKRDIGDTSKELDLKIKNCIQFRIKLEKNIDYINGKIEELDKFKSADAGTMRVSARKKISPKVMIKFNGLPKEINEELTDVSVIYTKSGITVSRFSSGKITGETSANIKTSSATSEQIDPLNIRKSIIIEGSIEKKAVETAMRFLDSGEEKCAVEKLCESKTKCRIFAAQLKEGEDKIELISKLLPVKRNAVLTEINESKKIKISGDTLDDCVKKAYQKYKVEKSKLKYSVIKKGKSGVFGIGKEPFVIEIEI
ncbi:MAG TPA: FapA family protein [bacterium]|nr:FapA family protein [bacterium]